MSVRINTNIEALNAQRNLGVNSARFAKSVEKLSSGLRINRAADDSAGLAISEKLRAQVRGLNQAQRNAQDGISMVQTAEGALNEVHSMLQRMRELAVQAGNSTVSTGDLVSVNTELVALQTEINRIGNATTFNGQALLAGVLATSQAGGTLAAGLALIGGTNTSVTKVDVSGARAATTYTLAAGTAAGTVSLSDGAGNSQQVTLAGIAALGSQEVNFSSLGVTITVSSVTGDTAANVAAALAASMGAGPSTIGGAAGTDLVNGDVLNANATVTASGNVSYSAPAGLDKSGGATPLTATASAGVGAGTFHIDFLGVGSDIDDSGHITVTYDGELFTGDLAAVSPGASSTAVLTGGTTGNTITLAYKQNSAPVMGGNFGLAYDVGGSSFTFVASGTAATIANLAAPTATAGTYSFMSGALGQITLTGPGGTQTVAVADTLANGTQTLNFNTLGISFQLQANGLGTFSKESAIGNFTAASNDTIVVSAGVGGAAGTVITSAGGGATFQIGANSGQTMGVTFADARTATYAGFDTAISTFTAAKTNANAAALIAVVDVAISQISGIRGGLGAVQNRLEYTTASLGIASENLTASESRIRDLDVASEMVSFTKTQILQQAGTAIIAQANQAPQGILSLLR